MKGPHALVPTMSTPAHDNGSGEPIKLEPIDDSPPSVVKKEDDSWEPQSNPLTLAPETPVHEDPVLAEIEKFRVPNSTSYRCAHCDYILAGLTSRRCPECGEPFTIDEALLHGRESPPDMAILFAAVRRDTFKFYAGVFMLFAGFMAPNIRGGASFKTGPLSFRGLIMLIFMIPVLAFTTYFRQSGDVKWCDMIFIAGLIVLAGGIIVALP
jgi:hypothetical protein